MIVELISVGTEILLGNIVNTNAAYLSRQCAALGLDLYTQTVVGDNDDRLERFFNEAFKRADVVILTGGLGPTEDDLTKESVCKSLEIGLTEDEIARENMESILRKSGFEPTKNNYKQAMVPIGSKVLYNKNGTAPGFIIEKYGHAAILLPGPPIEMEPMFEEQVMPYLKAKSGHAIYSHTLKECGLGESRLETILLDLIDKQSNPTIATYAKTGYSEVRITAKSDSEDSAKEIAKPVIKEIKKRLGDAYFTNVEDAEPENVVVDLLKKYNLKISTAESCTGGLVASKLVNVSGASDVFTHGFITYSNKAKRKVLGVDRDTLKKYSAVSKEVAREMAKGAVLTADTEVAGADTGYAGPGDSEEEPKGLVFIACAVGDTVVVEKFNFTGNRQKIRENAAVKALNLVRTSILAAYKQ